MPEKIAMLISGQKTRTVFERYNITSEKDIKDATKKSYEYQKMKEAEYLKAREPQEPEPTYPEVKEETAERKVKDKLISFQAYRKKKIS